MNRPLGARVRWLTLFISMWAAPACGANVVFGEDGGGGEGGAEPDYECVLGSCGEACVKCEGDACFDGICDAAGRCTPPTVGQELCE